MRRDTHAAYLEALTRHPAGKDRTPHRNHHRAGHATHAEGLSALFVYIIVLVILASIGLAQIYYATGWTGIAVTAGIDLVANWWWNKR